MRLLFADLITYSEALTLAALTQTCWRFISRRRPGLPMVGPLIYLHGAT